MAEHVDVKIARLEEKFSGLEAKIDDAATKLSDLVSMADEWRGVRKALSALGAMLLGIGTIGGAFVGYFWPHTR